MNKKLSDRKEVSIIDLPPMTVASISKKGIDPEDACWQEALVLIKEYNLDKQTNFRNIGHGYNDLDGIYIYELWITVPEDFNVNLPFQKKKFTGGKYASLECNLSNIGEKWDEIHEIVLHNKDYEHDTSSKRDMYLEECLDIKTFHSKSNLSEKNLNLYLPIKLKENQEEIKASDIKIEKIVLPDLLIGGTYFDLKEAVSPWKKRVPWYLLAQNIYKVGPGFTECMNHGNNTFTLVYGKSINSIPFYLDLKKGKVDKVFAGVELVKSFSNYPIGLQEFQLNSKRYMVFSMSIDPKYARSMKLNFKDLYNAVNTYFNDKSEMVYEDYCLEREYRHDGRYVDKIELYIPIK